MVCCFIVIIKSDINTVVKQAEVDPCIFLKRRFPCKIWIRGICDDKADAECSWNRPEARTISISGNTGVTCRSIPDPDLDIISYTFYTRHKWLLRQSP